MTTEKAPETMKDGEHVDGKGTWCAELGMFWPDPDGTTYKCRCGADATNTGWPGEYHCETCGETWAT